MNTFASEIRKLRAGRQLNQQQLAEALNVSKSLIAGFETGRLIPQPDTAADLDELFGSGDRVQQMSAEARKDRQPWMRPWVEHERRATVLRAWEPTVIPGLLQTPAYARTILVAGPHTDEEVAELTTGRLGRQEATLGRDKPVVLTAVIGEPALRYGPPEVMKPQLEHLIDVGDRPNVHVHVLPVESGLHAGLAGPFVIADQPDGTRVAYLDDQLAGRVATNVVDIGTLEVTWAAIAALALSAQPTRNFILRMIDELT